MNAVTSTLQKLASPAFYQTSYRNYMLNYAKKYIHTGSGAPMVHAMVGAGPSPPRTRPARGRAGWRREAQSARGTRARTTQSIDFSILRRP